MQNTHKPLRYTRNVFVFACLRVILTFFVFLTLVRLFSLFFSFQFLTFELVRDKIFLEIPAAQESVFYALVVSQPGHCGVAGAMVGLRGNRGVARIFVGLRGNRGLALRLNS